jgi:hypothetical protein
MNFSKKIVSYIIVNSDMKIPKGVTFKFFEKPQYQANNLRISSLFSRIYPDCCYFDWCV